jgi:glutamate-1-semialdehyde 2,1-aminomutase
MSFAILALIITGALAVPFVWSRLWARLLLSRAKHPSLRGHVRIARWVARHVPAYSYDEQAFFDSDGAPAAVVMNRRRGLARLSELFRARFEKTLQLTAEAAPGLADLQFTAAYRVPFPYNAIVREKLAVGVFARASRGKLLIDLDGNELYDLSGSYGVNLFGHEFYKACIERGSASVRELGPVLGTYHPLIVPIVQRLREISGLDQVSFHMSGTEAVMQAVRLARYHTGRSNLVRFCGAYHGWWGDVQPGIGNPVPARETFTLKDLDPLALRVLRTRRDIACVLVNPLQALHPNANAPSDSALVDSTRAASFDRETYSDWLRQLRQVCSERGIVLIFDEVFVGFRLALGGAQEYFGVRADMVIYGKTLGGGLPVGVVCGRAQLMKRFREDRPADICFARGTFNSHPYVLAAMHEFLQALQTPELQALYRDLDARWNARAAAFNQRMQAESLPVRVANLSSIWTMQYTAPARYNWLFQYYLRAAGIALSWVGTGRLIFSLDYSDADFQAVLERCVAAAQAMHDDGYFWSAAELTNRAIKRRILHEMIARSISRSRSGSRLGRQQLR